MTVVITMIIMQILTSVFAFLVCSLLSFIISFFPFYPCIAFGYLYSFASAQYLGIPFHVSHTCLPVIPYLSSLSISLPNLLPHITSCLPYLILQHHIDLYCRRLALPCQSLPAPKQLRCGSPTPSHACSWFQWCTLLSTALTPRYVLTRYSAEVLRGCT